MPLASNRRDFFRSTLTAAAAGAALQAAACSDSSSARTGESAPGVSYASLGVKPVINGIGTVTILGGSIMPPEVVDAMVEASKNFVPMRDLQLKAGEHLAKLIGVPAAMITCGAASAITVGTAAAVTRGDDEKLRRLPFTDGMPNEIIQQNAHRDGYEAQMWLVGTKTIWVDTVEQLEKAINERTAMMFFLNKGGEGDQITRQQWLEVAKKHNIPTMNDAAADVPPPERLHSYVEEGWDMVVFSGGKGLLGPQASGLLLGREDLIAAGQKAISPAGGIGRGMKVGKEEIMGLVAAVERYLKVDHAAERAELDRRAAHVTDTLKGLDGVTTEVDVPEIANHVPHVIVKWDEGAKGMKASEATEKLLAGDPPVAVSRTGEGTLRISMWMLRTGEEKVVASRVRGLFA